MIKKILVPTDFSACAENAIDYAAAIAGKTEAEITLLHVYTIPVVDAGMIMPSVEAYINEIESSGRRKLKDSVLRIKKQFADMRVSTRIKSGFAVSDIVDYAKKGKFDLVVMGTRGASGLEELLVGSNAASVLEKCICPVLAIPESSSYKGVFNILYTTDLTMPEARTMKRLIDFARLFDAQITIMHVNNEGDRYFKLNDLRFEHYGKMMDYDKIRMDRIDNVEGENVFESINNYIQWHNFDMVAMATHSRGFIDKLFHRSLTKRMAYHTHIPLISFRKD